MHTNRVSFNGKQEQQLSQTQAQRRKISVPMKKRFVRVRAEKQPIERSVAIARQVFELIGDGKIEELAVVEKHTAQEPSGWGVGLEGRVEWATTTELAMAGPIRPC